MLPSSIASLFPRLGNRIYMNTASIGVGSAPATDALKAGADSWSAGQFDFIEAERAGEEARALFAKLVNVRPDCVALIPTASAVAGQLAAHLRTMHPGGNILVGAEEYTSVLFPWLQLKSHGLEVRLLPFQGGGVAAEHFAAAADANTRLIAVSAVQSATGYRVNLAALREVADRSRALLYVDAAQLAGALRLDAAAYRIDALSAPSHKFLLGTRGMGYAYFNRQLRDAMMPAAPGWKAAADPFASFYGPGMTLSTTASRFDQSLAWINAMAERESLRVIRDIGFEGIDAYNTNLVSHMRLCLKHRKIDFLDHGPQHSSTIFSILPNIPDAERRLAEGGIVAAIRGGRVRLSLHLYNSVEQIERVVSLLAS